MVQPVNLTSRLIDAFYAEGLTLSDAVRAAFAPGRPNPGRSERVRQAFLNEALRTTTRMMQAVAWLIYHRAHQRGEISDAQLQRHCRITPSSPAAAAQLALLPPELRDLVRTTERFHARLARIDAQSRDGARAEPPVPAIDYLQHRLSRTAARR